MCLPTFGRVHLTEHLSESNPTFPCRMLTLKLSWILCQHFPVPGTRTSYFEALSIPRPTDNTNDRGSPFANQEYSLSHLICLQGSTNPAFTRYSALHPHSYQTTSNYTPGNPLNTCYFSEHVSMTILRALVVRVASRTCYAALQNSSRRFRRVYPSA